MFLLTARICAQNDPEKRKTFAIHRTDTPPVIDGHLDDAVWQNAVVMNDFHQNNSRYRESTTEETIVQLLYDDEYSYVGADLPGRDPTGIRATEPIHGGNINSDGRSFISVDTFNSMRNDYFFQVNTNGTRSEALRENNGCFIADWVAIWQAESAVDESGLAIDMAIPFRSVSFDPELDSWGVNFGRWITRKQEFDLWPTNDRLRRVAENSGTTGIRGSNQGWGLDVVPSVNIIRRRTFDPMAEGLVLEPALDLFKKVTRSLTTTLTLVAAVSLESDAEIH